MESSKSGWVCNTSLIQSWDFKSSKHSMSHQIWSQDMTVLQHTNLRRSFLCKAHKSCWIVSAKGNIKKVLSNFGVPTKFKMETQKIPCLQISYSQLPTAPASMAALATGACIRGASNAFVTLFPKGLVQSSKNCRKGCSTFRIEQAKTQTWYFASPLENHLVLVENMGFRLFML